MEATATDVPHIAQFYVLVAVFCVSSLGYSAFQKVRDSTDRPPQSVPVAKQAHLSRNQSWVSRKIPQYIGKFIPRILSTLLVWK